MCKERSTRDPDQQHTEDQGPCIWSIEAGADSDACAVLRRVDTMRPNNVSNARFASKLLTLLQADEDSIHALHRPRLQV